jgi:hypothetical protein
MHWVENRVIVFGILFPLAAVKKRTRGEVEPRTPQRIIENDHLSFVVAEIGGVPQGAFGYWRDIVAKTFGPIGTAHAASCDTNDGTGQYDQKHTIQRQFSERTQYGLF